MKRHRSKRRGSPHDTAWRIPALGALLAGIAAGGAPVREPAAVEVTPRPIPAAERDRIGTTLERAVALLPRPEGALDIESRETALPESAGWSVQGGSWLEPGVGSAEVVYAPRGGEGVDPSGPPAPELRVTLNGEIALPTALATVGEEPARFGGLDAPAVVVRMIGSSPQGRVALPLDPQARENALTVIRIYIGPRDTAARVGDLLAGRKMSPRPVRAGLRPGDVRLITVQIYGGRRDVESLARRVPVARLRSLLTRP